MRYLILTVFLLAGCAEQQFWHLDYPNWRPEKIVILDMEPDAYCPHPMGAIGCAMRIDNTCTVWIRKDTPNYNCVLEHELKHCAGFDHPNFPHTQDGCFFTSKP